MDRRIIFVATCFLLVQSKTIQKSADFPYKCTKEYDDRCLPDGSGMYSCFFKRGAYRPVLHQRCNGTRNTCRCYASSEVSYCRCVDPRPAPAFPDTGVIRWEGNHTIETYNYPGGKKYRLFGEIRKDAEGNVLRKWAGDEGKHQYFDLTVPSEDGEGFVMYIGNSNSKKCQSCKVQHPKNLSSLWSRSSTYNMLSETKMKETIEQKWSSLDQAERLRPRHTSWDTFYFPTWYLSVNKDDNEAVPKMFEYDISDGFVEYYETVKLDFTYEARPSRTFRLQDLCAKENIVEGFDCDRLASRDPPYFQGRLN